MILVDSGPKTGVGSSLKLLSLGSALLFLLALYRSKVASNFLIDKLYTKSYLLLITEQGSKTFYIAINHIPVDIKVLESFLQATLTASLDRYVDNRFFARICITGELIFVV